MTKRNARRLDDGDAQRLIERNRATIERLADHLSAGAYSASRAPRAEPQPQGLIIHAPGAPARDDAPSPYVRISPNDRVVVADHATGRQLQFLGEIRRRDGVRRFVLATKVNGFFSPLADEVAGRLGELDGVVIGRDYGEEQLALDIRRHLGMN